MTKPNFALKTLAAALLAGGFCQGALACTTIIAGRNATADGSVLVARLEDYTYNNHAKRFVVVPAQTYKDGDTLSFDNGVSVPAPKAGMRYTAMRDWNGDQRGALGPWSEFGANEAGVILSATNSTEPNDKAAKADPLVGDEGGVIEAILPDLILPQAKTAREGVELLGKYVETLGAGETNGIQIADDKEAWLFEIGSGHHWIAVRVPDDGYVVMANGMRVHDADLNDKANVLSSAGIAEFAEKHQLLDKVDPAKFNFAKAFGIVGDAYNVDREWLVQSKLEPGRKQDIRQQQYPFYTKPEKPISVEQVAAILRIDNYAGTPLDGKKPAGDQKQRPIAMERNVEAHILQVRPQMPKGLQVLSWQSLGNVRDGLLLPYYLESLRSTPRVCSSRAATTSTSTPPGGPSAASRPWPTPTTSSTCRCCTAGATAWKAACAPRSQPRTRCSRPWRRRMVKWPAPPPNASATAPRSGPWTRLACCAPTSSPT